MCQFPNYKIFMQICPISRAGVSVYHAVVPPLRKLNVHLTNLQLGLPFSKEFAESQIGDTVYGEYTRTVNEYYQDI